MPRPYGETKMSGRSFALIAEQDYQSFRVLPKNDFPETFEMWARAQRQQKDHHCLEFHPHGVAIDVEVNVAEFIAYCAATQSNPTMQAIGGLASEKGGRENK
jgi:hypothetical protein